MAAKGCTPVDTLRVVLLGKTGNGKSTLGNALTGLKAPDAFKVGRGMQSETRCCNWNIAMRGGTTVEVTDTPGLCDTKLPEEHIYKEVAKSVAVATPGPHVIIYVLRCDRRFTEVEHDAYDRIKQLFSEEMNKYLILVFNGLDTFKHDAKSIEEQRQRMAKDMQMLGEPMTSMVKEAGDRILGMNYKVSLPDQEKQAYELINMMKELVRQNGHKYYRTEMTKQINQKVEELISAEAAKQVSEDQARKTVNDDIISETVSHRSLEFLVDVVRQTVSRIAEGFQSACAVM